MSENANVTYEIKRKIGVISTNPKTNWTTELNFIEWNGNPAKFDIRDWSPEKDKMSKGITLSVEEAEQLYKLLAIGLGKA